MNNNQIMTPYHRNDCQLIEPEVGQEQNTVEHFASVTKAPVWWSE